MEVFIELAKRASFSRAEVKKLASAIGWGYAPGIMSCVIKPTATYAEEDALSLSPGASEGA